MELTYKERQLALIRQILRHRVFRETLKLCLTQGEMPKPEIIVEIMKNSNLYNINAESTFFRRSSTIVGWINWILDTID